MGAISGSPQSNKALVSPSVWSYLHDGPHLPAVENDEGQYQ